MLQNVDRVSISVKGDENRQGDCCFGGGYGNDEQGEYLPGNVCEWPDSRESDEIYIDGI